MTARMCSRAQLLPVQIPRIIPHYNFLRKPASDSGWDWGPGFAPSGLSAVALVGCSCAEILGGHGSFLTCSQGTLSIGLLLTCNTPDEHLHACRCERAAGSPWRGDSAEL